MIRMAKMRRFKIRHYNPEWKHLFVGFIVCVHWPSVATHVRNTDKNNFREGRHIL